jgi:DNA-binding NarL/FixJ family response regulator
MASRRLRSIVIADDQPLERLGVASVLRQAVSFEQLQLAASFDSIRSLLDDNTDLVVVDDQVPGLTSVEELRKLRIEHPTVKFVLICKDCTPSAVFAGLLAGVSGYISKALEPAEMTNAFRLIVQGHVYVPADLSADQILKSDDVLDLDEQWDRLMQLSARQRQVLQLACEGSSNKEIARKLSISQSTVKVHVGAAFRRIGVKSRVEAAAVFREHRLAGGAQAAEGGTRRDTQQVLPFSD